jgi:hypothetical protein
MTFSFKDIILRPFLNVSDHAETAPHARRKTRAERLGVGVNLWYQKDTNNNDKLLLHRRKTEPLGNPGIPDETTIASCP